MLPPGARGGEENCEHEGQELALRDGGGGEAGQEVMCQLLPDSFSQSRALSEPECGGVRRQFTSAAADFCGGGRRKRVRGRRWRGQESAGVSGGVFQGPGL